MPKADPPTDAEMYKFDIEEKDAKIRESVDHTKWVIELVGLFALNTAVSSVFIALVKRAQEVGLSPRLACGIGASMAVGYLVSPSVGAIILATAESILLRIRKALRIPHGLEDANVIFRALWRATVQTIALFAWWGAAIWLAEYLKTGSLG